MLKEALNKLYYDLTLNELRLMNDNTLYPNISYNSLLYLDLIDGGENVTTSYLAGALHISKPAVTAKVNELVAQGLVQKVQSETDKRVHYLSLTPDISADYREYDKKLENAIGCIEQKYTPDQIGLFVEMVADIRKEYIQDP